VKPSASVPSPVTVTATSRAASGVVQATVNVTAAGASAPTATVLGLSPAARQFSAMSTSRTDRSPAGTFATVTVPDVGAGTGSTPSTATR